MLNICICDDEIKYINEIKSILIDTIINYDYIIDTYLSGEELLSSCKKNIDILFIDIEMKEINGIDTVKELKKKNPNMIIFYCTLYDKFLTEIFRLGTFQFVHKPINKEELQKDIIRSLEYYTKIHFVLNIDVNHEIIYQEVSQIKYLEVYQHKIKMILTDNKVLEFKGNLNTYEKKLLGYNFVKSHKSYLINMNYISKLGYDYILIKDNTDIIPLSRNYKDEFKLKFNKYIMEKIV